MRLHTLLRDRASINILKILYDNEFGENKKHTMRFSDIKANLVMREMDNTLSNLDNAGLISAEEAVNGELVLSITKKGKEFVEQFDKLLDVMAGRKQEQKAYQVQYNLTPLEQRMLILCAKMKSESGSIVQLKTLTQEVYPYSDPAAKTGIVSKYAKKLEELNLLLRVKKNNRTFFDVTESGERVIKEQFLEGVIKH